MAKAKLKNWLDSLDQDLGHDQEELDKLSEFEQKIAHLHHLMRIASKSKTSRHVPVLISKGVVFEAVALLVQLRESVGQIEPTNVYLFGDSSDGYVKPWPPMRELSEKYGCSEPELIRGTMYRRHLATSIQVLNLKENELDIAAGSMVSQFLL